MDDLTLGFPLPPIEQIAVRIGWPVAAWEGHCYSVACAILAAKIFPGQARYGHYSGPVAPGTLFDLDMPFIRHGWIELPDGTIIDPTRWVFEGAPPYLWIGHNTGEYDAGGQRWLQAIESPPPLTKPGDLTVDLPLTPAARAFVLSLLGDPPTITDEHAWWLANLSLSTLGEFTRPIYEALAAGGYAMAIPIDNYRLVLADHPNKGGAP